MLFCIKIYGKAIIPKGFLRVIKVLWNISMLIYAPKILFLQNVEQIQGSDAAQN